MKVESARRLASRYLNVGTNKIKIKPEFVSKIKESITGEDIKGLILDKGIFKEIKGQSRGRARILLEKKKKGRKRGIGKRKGTSKARVNPKLLHIIKARSQRKYIRLLLDTQKISKETYRDLYKKIKGGYFRTKAHISIYLSKLSN